MNRSVPVNANGTPPPRRSPLHSCRASSATALARSWISQPNNHRRRWRQDRRVECHPSPDDSKKKPCALPAFLMSYYGTDNHLSAERATLRHHHYQNRLARVTVVISRATPTSSSHRPAACFQPPELLRLQGFPSNYIHTHGNTTAAHFANPAQGSKNGRQQRSAPYPRQRYCESNPPAPVEQLGGGKRESLPN